MIPGCRENALPDRNTKKAALPTGNPIGNAASLNQLVASSSPLNSRKFSCSNSSDQTTTRALLQFLFVAEVRDHVVQFVPRDESAAVVCFVFIDRVAQFGRSRTGVVSSVAKLTSVRETFWSSIAGFVSSIFESLSRLARLLEG
jgi:hypothetical protein